MQKIISPFLWCKSKLSLPEFIYLLGLSIIGIIFVYRITPMSGIDEMYHFFRAQQVAQGNLLAQRYANHAFGGGLDSHMIDWVDYFNEKRNQSLPADVLVAQDRALTISSTPVRKITLQFPSTASYSPIMYIPSAIGMDIAKLFHSRPDTQYYAGRLGNLFGYMFLLCLLLSILPCTKLPLLVLLTTPTALHLATTYSADPVTNLGALIFIACCLRLRLSQTSHAALWLNCIFALAIILGLLKLTCSLLSLTCFLIPSAFFKSKKNYFQYCVLVCSASVSSAVIWNGFYPFNPAHYWNTGGDSHVQIQNMIIHPIVFLQEILNTYKIGTYWWWEDAWGRFGGGPIPLFFKIGEKTGLISVSLMIGLALIEKNRAQSFVSSGFLLALGALYSLLIILAFYVGFSHAGEGIVSGLQGRYFILSWALYLCAFSLCVPKLKLNNNYLSSVLLFANFICVLHVSIEAITVYARYWH